MKEAIYFDTSALANLNVLEVRCLLGRRRREGHIDSDTELRVFAALLEEIRQRPNLLTRGPDNNRAGRAEARPH